MTKIPHLTEDEHGHATLPLPRLGRLERLHLPRFLQRHPALYAPSSRRNHLLLLGGAGAAITTIVAGWFMLIYFFVPTTLGLSFGTDSCTFNPVLLPRLTEHQPSGNFEAFGHETLTVAGYPVFSHKTCVRPKAAPQAGTTETVKLAPLGNPLLHKRISVVVDELPSVAARTPADQPISAGGALEFQLDQPDTIFTYAIAGNSGQSLCLADGADLTCPLSELGLAPGSTYELVLQRMFKDEPAQEMLKLTVKTLDPVIITASSVAPDSTAYHKPTSVDLTVNKPLQQVDEATLTPIEPAGDALPASVSFDKTSVSVRFGSELPRETLFELRIPQATADDGSQLVQAYVLRFRTSGGPKVAGASIGSSRVSTAASVTLTFDSNLAPGQNVSGKARILIGNSAVAAGVSASGNRLVINPSSELPRCQNFSVVLDGGLISEHGIGNGAAWRMNSRTVCHTAFSIGRSVRGRNIMAYRYGTGASKIVFVGGMHGNEKSSTRTLEGWMDYLEMNAERLPAHRSIIVIPNHNPDGYAASRRTNLNNVDLNRNFPSNDWATAVQMPGNQFLPNGGGIAPLDQPESAALASFIQSQNPRLVLTYHAVARVVISNDVGDSIALSQQYARDSGYSFTSNADSHGTFEYATTGEFEDWLADKEGIPGILVELSSMSSNQFGSHRSAMWNLATMP